MEKARRRNIYMGQEYLDMEAITVNERRRTGRAVSVADVIRLACREYKDFYWRNQLEKGHSDASHRLPEKGGASDS